MALTIVAVVAGLVTVGSLWFLHGLYGDYKKPQDERMILRKQGDYLLVDRTVDGKPALDMMLRIKGQIQPAPTLEFNMTEIERIWLSEERENYVLMKATIKCKKIGIDGEGVLPIYEHGLDENVNTDVGAQILAFVAEAFPHVKIGYK